MVTFAMIPFNNTTSTIERVERVLLPTLRAYPSLNYQVVLSDNSAQRSDPLLVRLREHGVPFDYEWNRGQNLFYGGALTRLFRLARYETLVYLCSNHGIMNDPTWLGDLISPLQDEKIAMSGSVQPCSYRCFEEEGGGVHVQGGIFAAKTSIVRCFPYPAQHIHQNSDIWISREVMRHGYRLADVSSIGSSWGKPLADRHRWKIIHESGF